MFNILYLGKDPFNKPGKFWKVMSPTDLVTDAVVGIHYDPRTFVAVGRTGDVKYRKIKVISIWLRPRVILITLRK